MSILEFKQLSFGFDSNPFIKDLNFELSGGLNWLVGGDGKGKTSVLKLITNELKPQNGEINYHSTLKSLGNSCYKEIFWINPNQIQFENNTALEAWTEIKKSYPRWNQELCLELAQAFSLNPHLAKPLYMLSAGSKRKVWLCAAFAASATLTLIDEPFAALDLASQQIVLELLEDCMYHPTKAYLVADYLIPDQFATSKVINLGD